MFASGGGRGRRPDREAQVLEAIKLSLDHGADVRAFNDAGATALHLRSRAVRMPW